MNRSTLAVLASVAVVAGCSSMLPRGTSDTPSPFETGTAKADSSATS